MSVEYREEDYNEFEELCYLVESRVNSERITGRIRMPVFVEKHTEKNM